MAGDAALTLFETIRSGETAAVAERLRAGDDADRPGPDGLTPLMVAAGLGHLDIVDLLLRSGVAVSVLDSRAGSTALHKAALAGSADVAARLLDHDAFIDQQGPILGQTALMDAVVYKQDAVVRLLLDRGARTSILNHWGETALDLARRDGLAVITSMIETAVAADTAEIARQALLPAILSGDLDAVERLIAQGASVNARRPLTGTPEDDYTPIALAAREGRADMVEALLRAGADPRGVIGLYLGTALHEACYFGHVEVLRVLLGDTPQARAAADLGVQGAYNGMSPLHDAVWHGRDAAARALVEAGHPLDLRTHAGLTARELASRYGYDDLASFLAEAEAAVSETDAPR